VIRKTTKRLIAEQLPNLNSKKINKACFEAKGGPGKKSLAFSFLFKEIHALKRQFKPEKTASSKKRTRKAESILSTEFNLTTNSDEGEKQEYLFTSSKPFRSSKAKLAKSSHPTINHLVGSV
jgi:hypothetical protein